MKGKERASVKENRLEGKQHTCETLERMKRMSYEALR